MDQQKQWAVYTILISVLQGGSTSKVKSWGHDKLSTFGIMAEISQEKIRHILRFLMQQGYINSVGDKYPVLETTQKAREILNGQVNISIPQMPEVKKKKQILVNEKLFDGLKALRSKIAYDENVPAFIIFSDAALRDMCLRLPRNNNEFMKVSGVGEVKLKKYGEVFLDVINKFSDSNEIPDIVKTNKKSWDEFLAVFQISDEPIHLTEFLQRVNEHAVPMLGEKIPRTKISSMLEDAGYLEDVKMGKKTAKYATQKGNEIGISIVEREKENGERYKINMYDQNAQRMILDFVIKSFFV